MHNPSRLILRIMLICLVLAYGLALYVQWHWPFLSTEATKYQQVVWMTMSGFDLSYGLQKLLWALGNVVGAIGVGLLFFRFRSGLPMLLVSPILLGAAPILGASPSAYPDLGRPTTTILWCVCSAMWGCVVTYALAGDNTLFAQQAADARSRDRI